MYRFSIVACAVVVAASSVAAQQSAPGTALVPTQGRGEPRDLARPAGTRVAPPAAKPLTGAPRVLPGTHETAFTTIQGTALDSASAPMPKTLVRLRDARVGKIVATQVTDDAGAFSFTFVDPGSYVVELVGTDQTVLAASHLLSVNAGDAAAAVVKLPFKIPPFGGLLGHSAASALVVAGSAAAAGVLAVQVAECVSPPCGNP
jgi:hypothetical protein